jgi:drug/metabolite transporter (DMT)-like permease
MSKVDGGGAATRWIRWMPAVFVLIWSTGFIVARYGMPYAPPLSFLSIRYALSIICFLFWIGLAGVRWPTTGGQWGHLAVAGILMHAGYLGGVWAAVKAGMGAGLSALIVGLQPVLTALWLSYRGAGGVSIHQWIGLVFGFAGLVLVVSGKLVHSTEASGAAIIFAVIALLSITAGTLYQKRFVASCDVRAANTVQLMAALVVTLPFALWESEPIEWTSSLAIALGWSVLGLTIGGSSLLYLLIQRGAAAAVSSLMYLVPPVTAIMAWVLFSEPISWAMLLGIVVTATGVALVVRPPLKQLETK